MKYQDLLKQEKLDKKLLQLVLIDYFKVTITDILNNEECKIDLEEFHKIIDELQKDKPYQYIKKESSFYGRSFYVDENVLIPRFETEGLIEETLKYINEMFIKPNILDLCTGSGIIAITLSKELNIKVDASYISIKALEVAKKNNKLLGADVNFIESDLFANINRKYDVIISNPPYIKTDETLPISVKKYEPHLALYAGSDGLDYYEKILFNVKDYLNDKYLIAFEIGMTQNEDIISIANKYLKDIKCVIKKDLQGRNRYLFVIHE